MRVKTVCVDAEQKNAKQNYRTWLEKLLTIREYNFQEGGGLVVASVACVVSRRFLASCKNIVEGCRFFQINVQYLQLKQVSEQPSSSAPPLTMIFSNISLILDSYAHIYGFHGAVRID